VFEIAPSDRRWGPEIRVIHVGSDPSPIAPLRE